jgi:hypothetical protein
MRKSKEFRCSLFTDTQNAFDTVPVPTHFPSYGSGSGSSYGSLQNFKKIT